MAKKGRDAAPLGGEDAAVGAPALPPYTPPNLIKARIKEHFLKVWEEEWTKSNLSKYKHSRKMLKVPNRVPLIPPGRPPLKWGREDLRGLVEVVTGHCLLNKHLAHWKDLPSKNCRLCDESEETYQHLVFECPATELNRRETLRDQYDSQIDYFRDLNRFANIPRIRSLRRADLT